MATPVTTRLRRMLGELIPEGGVDTDTMFRDEQIQELLDEANGNLELAALEGWRAKAAAFSEMTDVIEGNSQEKLSQLMTNAQAMMKLYGNSRTGPTEGRTRIGKVVRPA